MVAGLPILPSRSARGCCIVGNHPEVYIYTDGGFTDVEDSAWATWSPIGDRPPPRHNARGDGRRGGRQGQGPQSFRQPRDPALQTSAMKTNLISTSYLAAHYAPRGCYRSPAIPPGRATRDLLLSDATKCPRATSHSNLTCRTMADAVRGAFDSGMRPTTGRSQSSAPHEILSAAITAGD